jgi:adenylyltransferase/sulfurtransferase
MEVKSVTVKELKALMDKQADFQLIDCREEDEHEFCNIGGELIPMGEIEDHIEKISKEKQVIIYCRSGNRSANVIYDLQQQYGYTNLYNLTGGILAWSREIDPTVPQY